MYGDWLPRHVFGKGHILCAILRSLYLSLCILLGQFTGSKRIDVFIVDQLSAPIPILRLAWWTRVLFYCHFPDKLLTHRDGLLKRAYRYPVDLLEEWTTSMSAAAIFNLL